jgi:hypothetical protein
MCVAGGVGTLRRMMSDSVSIAGGVMRRMMSDVVDIRGEERKVVTRYSAVRGERRVIKKEKDAKA